MFKREIEYPVFCINTEDGDTVFRTTNKKEFENKLKLYGMNETNDFSTVDNDENNLYAEVEFVCPTITYKDFLQE